MIRLDGVNESDERIAFITDAQAKSEKKRRAMRRHRRVKAAQATRFIAWDLETTLIAEGTPEPLHITAFSLDPGYALEMPIRDMKHLAALVISEFLRFEYIGIMFVAWNSNHFDSYFVASAILEHSDEYVIRPYLNRSNQLRGMRVIMREDINLDPSEQRSWEFVDGMAVLGLATVSLEEFLKVFAPKYRKLKEVIDFEAGQTFDSKNVEHRAYALRDSEGLWHGMVTAQRIMLEYFNQPLTVTIGNACIKIFRGHIPENVAIQPLSRELEDITREWVMRGGFCYCVQRYHGPVWKYDLNQAYAAAMREAPLPEGRASHSSGTVNRFATCYVARVSAQHARNRVPFYYCARVGSRVRAVFATDTISETWLTSIEIEQLQREGWRLTIHESWCWESAFTMREYVDKLEHVRLTCDGGPKGAIGTVMKAVGNHSYGKTVSEAPEESLILSRERPEGYAPYFPDGELTPVTHVWAVPEDKAPKDYEQPHIGAFITAHVRMVVRRAALLAPDAWLYADTDCCVFSRDLTQELDTDPMRYGAWKIEEEGTEFRIIGKKIYQNLEKTKAGYDPKKPPWNAKGLNTRRLTPEDYDNWFDGIAPTQTQIQRNNFIKVMAGMEMYRKQTRKGTAV